MVARRLTSAFAVGVVSAALNAHAGGMDLYGFGPRAEAMGGAMTAEANDHTAVFYNPALLTRAKDVNFGFAFQYHALDADVKQKDPDRSLICDDCKPAAAIGTSLGLVFPLGGKVKNHLALGVGLYLPTQRLLRLFGPDTSHPYWYRYTGTPEAFALNLGAGIKFTDWLSIGLGAQVLADLVGNGADVSVDLFSKRVNYRQIDATLATRVGPVFGLNVNPIKQLRLGVTFRWEMKLVYSIPAKVDLAGLGTLQFNIGGVAHFSPHTLSFGAAYDITEDFTIAVDGEWANWSAAPSPYMDLGIKLNGPTLAALGLDKAFDIDSPVQKTGFSDTLSGRLGAEYRITERFAARAGVSFRPTMVPLQNVAGTNLLDGTTVGAHLGLGFNFKDPLEILTAPIQIDIAGQAAFLLPREATKDASDAVPSYSYSARLFGVQASIRYDF